MRDLAVRPMIALAAASKAAASPDGLEEVTPRVMEAVCGALGWPAASTWIVDAETGLLRLCTFWAKHTGSAVAAQSRAMKLGPNSLPGRVREAAAPIWIPDVTTDPGFLRGPSAARDGLHTAVGVPIFVGEQVLGVMELFAEEVLEPDPAMLQMLGIVGAQVGLLVERNRAQRAQRRSEELMRLERRVLELVARGKPLGEALTELTRSIEQLVPGMLASVLRIDPDGAHLRHGASPSLPVEYSALIDGAAVGPDIGSCGTAAFHGRIAIASDISSDPRWVPWRDAALKHGLRACWSAPIFGTAGRVLGTFALYYREPREPAADHLALIMGAAHVAAVAMERHRLDEERGAMIEDLSRAVRYSEMFAGVLGHDLRNPLGAITASATLIQLDPSPNNARENAERILSSSLRINGMIEQLLDVTRIRLDKGLQIVRRSLDLGELCRYVAGEIGDSRKGRGPVLVEQSGDATGMWDRDRLLQVLSNLLGNAAQHGAPDAPISARIDGTSAQSVTLTVENAGEIPPALLDVLFDPLRRAESGSKKRQGLGLGLFISQQIVVAHGGTIELCSTGGRTTFTVSLPRGGRTSEAAPPVITFDARGAGR